MYYVEIKNNKCTGNYSENVKQDSFENYIEVEELPSDIIDGFEVSDGKIISPNYNLSEMLSELENLEAYLSSTDWYITRKYETGQDIPTNVSTERNIARQRISEIRVILNN